MRRASGILDIRDDLGSRADADAWIASLAPGGRSVDL